MSISTALIRRLAEAEGKDPAELPPLGNVVDPGVLETVIESADESVYVAFSYRDHSVSISGDGTIRLDETHQ
ncbi:HalOD1 output domain-containing protein [Haloarcula laminariae]|uniref:HalOD1 output domain-containing protein n=1 Tax=Haloarcula laminariae TaxID=2961577 RepID=UPI0021C66F84|nr:MULTISPECIES: HalOD1 output domain-containing protein [Halomicroarcula]